MGLGDKIEDLAGKAKEAIGDKTDNPGLEAEGHRDQAEGKAGEAQDNVTDALRDAGRATKFDNA